MTKTETKNLVARATRYEASQQGLYLNREAATEVATQASVWGVSQTTIKLATKRLESTDPILEPAPEWDLRENYLSRTHSAVRAQIRNAIG